MGIGVFLRVFLTGNTSGMYAPTPETHFIYLLKVMKESWQVIFKISNFTNETNHTYTKLFQMQIEIVGETLPISTSLEVKCLLLFCVSQKSSTFFFRLQTKLIKLSDNL